MPLRQESAEDCHFQVMATLQAARAYVLLSREGFFKEVYRPKRDELAEKWTEMSQRRF